MDSAAGAGFNTAETRAITSNEWHMVTCSYMPDTTPGNAPSGNMTLYLDGKWLGTLDVYATLPLTTEHRFIVGNSGAEGDTGYGGNHLGGMIDEVAVFDTALTGWDVYKLYTAAQIPPPKGTVVLIR